MPNNFYAPYAYLEPESTKDRRLGEHILEIAISEAVKQTDISFIIHVSDIVIRDKDDIDFDTLIQPGIETYGSIKDHTFTLDDSYGVKFSSQLQNNEAINALLDFLPADNLFGLPIGIQGRHFHYIKLFPRPNSRKDSKAFRALQVPSRFADGLIVSFNDEDDARLRSFYGGITGDPTKLSGAVFRMMYFSAVAITTVGFGDIVPLTTLARTLAAAESIFGILMGGLFLAGIGSQVVRKNSSGVP